MDPVAPLISSEKIASRVRDLAGEILAGDENGDARDLLLVVLLNGAFVFAADLMRALGERGGTPSIDFIAVSSYGDGTVSSGRVDFRCAPKRSVEGRDVLLVDDILDTGRSLHAVKAWMEACGAARVRTCVLLDKPSRRVADMASDFCGFEVPDRFVVGYGLDHDERYRHLPYVAALDEPPSRPR